MRWPWNRKSSGDRLVVSWSAQTLAFVRARATAAEQFEILQMGVERQGADTAEDFVRRLQGMGLKGRDASVVLRPEQYQLLQIDTPPVPPEELRAAARFQIRDMVESHIDDITLDVMRVGDDAHRSTNNLFVVAATNAMVRGVLDMADSMHWPVTVIDIQETAQRNLQSAIGRREGRLERASAALVLADERQAVLTISANEELFYTRRIELPQGFMAMDWNLSSHAPTDAFQPVEEYVPDYSVGGAAYGNDYSAPATATAGGMSGDEERAQRLLVEVQRSLDLWDRSWSSLPLAGLQVFAGERSAQLAQWLGREMGQSVAVSAMDVEPLFAGLPTMDAVDRAYCLPLLGALMRTESRKL